MATQGAASAHHPPLVYFGRRKGLVKIGTTTNFFVRALTVRPKFEEVLGVTPGSYDVEREWHSRWSDQRSDRYGGVEWFDLTDELLAAIRAVVLTPEQGYAWIAEHKKAIRAADGVHTNAVLRTSSLVVAR